MRLLGQKMQEAIAQSGQRYHEPLRIDALPKASSFRQVLSELHDLRMDKHFLDDLHQATADIWAKNRTAEEADWLAVTLGIASGNRKRTLELEAKKDGVHGMIAGGTGSGKSELLMTLIVGLALNYSPDILNFVLVDYKGGGAFKPFEKLPHCVDIVTNLNKAAVERMFTAINAEIRRRQALNVETNTKDIVDYRRRGFHLSREPYPHLFIIIDEYAEMIDDNPDYRRVGKHYARGGAQASICCWPRSALKASPTRCAPTSSCASACAWKSWTPAAKCCAAPTPRCCPTACPAAAICRSATKILS
ncbi:MAG: FtsK/SpoIIIE domain-containing protein [Caldilineaceae bacterium]